MKTFDFFFGLNLDFIFPYFLDNLLGTLQKASMSAVSAWATDANRNDA